MAGTILLQPSVAQAKKERKTRLLRKIIKGQLTVLGGLATALIPGGAVVKGAKYLAPVVGKVAKAVMPKTVKGAAGMVLAGGILSTSAKARKALREAPKTIYKSGKKLGEIIEDPKRAPDILGIKEGMSAKEKVISGAKTAGLYGAGIAGTLAVAGLVKKKLTDRKNAISGEKEKLPVAVEKLQPATRQLGFTEPQPVGLGGVPIIQAHPSSMGAPGQPVTRTPIVNTIQIQIV